MHNKYTVSMTVAVPGLLVASHLTTALAVIGLTAIGSGTAPLIWRTGIVLIALIPGLPVRRLQQLGAVLGRVAA